MLENTAPCDCGTTETNASDDELIDKTAAAILQKHLAAFEELAK